MSTLDRFMRFFNRHWVATNRGPHVGHESGRGGRPAQRGNSLPSRTAGA